MSDISTSTSKCGLPSQRVLSNLSHSIDDSLLGLIAVNRGLALLQCGRVIVRRDHDTLKDKVKLLAGGGSGHEPLHSAYVGPGMLTASIQGDIFQAPTSDIILQALREFGHEHEPGVLIIIANDAPVRLRFGIALERARAENIYVKMLNIGEDCFGPIDRATGRRGLSGVAFIHKIAGAMAEQGASLDRIYQYCKSIANENLSSCIAVFKTVVNDQCSCKSSRIAVKVHAELGCGLRGENGAAIVDTVTTAEDMVHKMLDSICTSATPLQLESGCRVALIVNNLGGASQLEERFMAHETIKRLTQLGVVVERSFSGKFVTSLDTNGYCISLLKIVDDEVLGYLDAPTSAIAWPKTLSAPPVSTTPSVFSFEESSSDESFKIPMKFPSQPRKSSKILIGPKIGDRMAQVSIVVLSFVCDALISCEKQLNILDSELGDGDTGSNIRKGADAIKACLAKGKINTTYPFNVLLKLSYLLEESIPGTLGALYGVALEAAASTFRTVPDDASVNASHWFKALQSSVGAIERYGGVKRGDRTMLDALSPASSACDHFPVDVAVKDPLTVLRAAAEEAESGARATIDMNEAVRRVKAEPLSSFKRFRSNDFEKKCKHPDPGAHAVGIWFRATYEALKLKYV